MEIISITLKKRGRDELNFRFNRGKRRQIKISKQKRLILVKNFFIVWTITIKVNFIGKFQQKLDCLEHYTKNLKRVVLQYSLNGMLAI